MPTYQPGTILLNRYRIERFLGGGAFAEVYLVTHLALNARYALKILNKDAGPGSTFYQDAIKRFRLEAQLGAALKHSPYIVPVYDFEEEDDLLILRMDYAPGGSLAQRLDAIRNKVEPPMSIDEAVRIAREVALGLAALHELDAVHRDVKPSNILFAEDGRAMLADLGLAQVPGGPSMRSIVSLDMPHPGTPDYMSPEQLSSPAALPPSSDIYALGRVLFEMLSGRQHRAVRPGTPVTKFRADAPDWLADLLNSMLSKNPEERPWNGEELAELLSQGDARQVARKQAEAEKARQERKAREEERRKREASEKARKEAEARAQQEREEAKRARQALLRKLKVPETVKVPAGEFIMGSPAGEGHKNERPQHEVYVDAFAIGKYPVTNEQYAVFVQDTGWRPPYHWEKGKMPENKAKHPVVNVSWLDAVVYCRWISKKTGREWRLPTEAEWEKAARGSDGRIYPWGNEPPDKTRCNYNMNIKDTTPVGHYPAGASPYGALDMTGNVWEWVADWYDRNYYAVSPARNPTGPERGHGRVLRGGSWRSDVNGVRTALRGGIHPDNRFDDVGFRCLLPSP